MRGSDVDHTGQFFLPDEEVECPREIILVNPRHELCSLTLRAPQTVAYQAEQHVEYPAAIRAERDRAPNRNPAGKRHRAGEKCVFPRLRNTDRKVPRIGGSRLIATQIAVLI